jgi:hypothetical protein
LFTVIVTVFPASTVMSVFSNFVEGTIFTSAPSAADELPPEREAAEVVVVVEVLFSLPHAASAARLTARTAPMAMTLGNRPKEGMKLRSFVLLPGTRGRL